MFGSIERFLAILLEHHGAALPGWLAPEQVAVVPVSADQRARADELAAAAGRAGLRCRVDAGDATLARRIAQAHHDGVPFVAVVGGREVTAGTVAVRGRDRRWTAPAGEAIGELVRACAGDRG